MTLRVGAPDRRRGTRGAPFLHARTTHIVLTTTNKTHLDSLVGRDSGAIEIVGKPYDMQSIADAVARGLEARRTTGDLSQFKARE